MAKKEQRNKNNSTKQQAGSVEEALSQYLPTDQAQAVASVQRKEIQ